MEKEKIIELVCTVNHGSSSFTVGNSYKVLGVARDGYRIRDDNGRENYYPLIGGIWCFMPVYEGTTTDNTTSTVEGLYSLDDIQNVLRKFDFNKKDLEEVVKEFKKLTKKDEKQEAKKWNEDELPF